MSRHNYDSDLGLAAAFMGVILILVLGIIIANCEYSKLDDSLSQALRVYRDPPPTAAGARCYDGFEFPPCDRQEELELYTRSSDAPTRVQCSQMPVNEQIVLEVTRDLDQIIADARDGSLHYMPGMSINEDTLSIQFTSRLTHTTYASYRPARSGTPRLTFELRTSLLDGAEVVIIKDDGFDGCLDTLEMATWLFSTEESAAREAWVLNSTWMIYRDLVLDLRDHINRP